ncbi:metal/formaldehyde-sensitive transcriptional repressor [Actomonas aquatica]|uniref:Metal/formaldehyde-sensitive transcriptional repressor n=1 Tax=Actomonas aquatica TaxID=2866162 RepID=A0ABZ1CFK6_9BACT|nr:metal/formaldehyde-sensitive transcriptional repressor [Opitutus sp. WL0086]WRQ90082.1 metal/formaldehyde-sensitive transcriptional repressor [Opitutus sp. WL0086]
MSHLHHHNKKLVNRVKRLKGQIEGIERMLEEGADCYKVLQNAAACRGAFDALTRELISDHIEHHLVREPSASAPVQQAAEELRQIVGSYLK